ncbi:MAG: hypothetical protein O9282_14815 [Flavobacterium sp.]|jgi:hypothetical protein|uniref:hypothetical protein n=1 Tax=Flavobacterium sp. TaxID=239 RepID=UPI0022C607E0|nr:hypothetical protein [Flavobacterium sp.]MCZ8023861.1 hypothetical protein [Cytophagales bacterium]MCZ8332579.1 hypothetical protein [Flavobacterium sp.]
METNQFPTPIPAWVKIYGFTLLIILVLSIIIFSFYFKTKRVIQIKLLESNHTLYAEYQLSEYETISALDTAQIELNTGEAFSAIINSNEPLLYKNNIRVPITVVDKSIFDKYFKHGDKYDAIVVVEKSTFFSKIFNQTKTLKL